MAYASDRNRSSKNEDKRIRRMRRSAWCWLWSWRLHAGAIILTAAKRNQGEYRLSRKVRLALRRQDEVVVKAHTRMCCFCFDGGDCCDRSKHSRTAEVAGGWIAHDSGRKFYHIRWRNDEKMDEMSICHYVLTHKCVKAIEKNDLITGQSKESGIIHKLSSRGWETRFIRWGRFSLSYMRSCEMEETQSDGVAFHRHQ